jgi:hypothetical protein
MATNFAAFPIIVSSGDRRNALRLAFSLNERPVTGWTKLHGNGWNGRKAD